MLLRIALGVLVGLQRDLGEAFLASAMATDVLPRGTGEHLQCQRLIAQRLDLAQGGQAAGEGGVQLLCVRFKRFYTDNQYAVRRARLDHLPTQRECGSRAAQGHRAGTGHVDQLHALHAASTLEIAASETGIGTPHLLMADTGIGQGQTTGFGCQRHHIRCGAWLAELCDPDTQDVDAMFHG
ncbi:hypothetical protein D3C78_1023270 [compost metagenome]